MKKFFVLATAVLPLMLSSCATPPPKQAFQNVDGSALVLQSLDGNTCQELAPATTAPENNNLIFDQAKALAQHQTAVVILENYSEPKLGPEFRNRTTDLFVGLRTLGYQHIVFLKGNGAQNPNGLLTLAAFN